MLDSLQLYPSICTVVILIFNLVLDSLALYETLGGAGTYALKHVWGHNTWTLLRIYWNQWSTGAARGQTTNTLPRGKLRVQNMDGFMVNL
eukprot:SAG31_NODE_2954_length_4863_cov_34.043451_3_plen_90_part_00